jgi:cytochrome c2
MRARRDESIWSTDAAAGYCRPVIVKPKADAAGRHDSDTCSECRAPKAVQRVGPYLCVVLGTALGYLCGYLWRVL